jgi:hypothetical protein
MMRALILRLQISDQAGHCGFERIGLCGHVTRKLCWAGVRSGSQDLTTQWNCIEKDCKEMKNAASQYKQMPDCMMVRQPSKNIKDYPCRVCYPSKEKQQNSLM